MKMNNKVKIMICIDNNEKIIFNCNENNKNLSTIDIKNNDPNSFDELFDYILENLENEKDIEFDESNITNDMKEFKAFKIYEIIRDEIKKEILNIKNDILGGN